MSLRWPKNVFKKTTANSERVTHESYIKLISWVALYQHMHIQWTSAHLTIRHAIPDRLITWAQNGKFNVGEVREMIALLLETFVET